MRTIYIALLGMAMVSCSSPCRLLSEKLCECEASSQARNACLISVASREEEARRSGVLDKATEARCSALIDGCDCRLIDTTNGKVACGLAYPPSLD